MQATENKRLTQVLALAGDSCCRDRIRTLPISERGGCSVKVAADRATREKAFQLVYEQYLEKGYAQKRASRSWVTLHDALPETVKLVVETAGEVVATGTVVPDSPLGLPADEIYSGELAALRRDGRRPAEVVSLATGEAAEGRTILAQLFNAAYLVARGILNATDLVVTVNPRHVPFYKRTLLFEDLGEERACSKVAGAPALLLRLDLEKAEGYARQAAGALPGDRIMRTLYPLFVTVQDAPHLLGRLRDSIRPMDHEDFGHFFIGLSDVLEKTTPAQRRYLQTRHPKCDFGRLFLTTTVYC